MKQHEGESNRDRCQTPAIPEQKEPGLSDATVTRRPITRIEGVSAARAEDLIVREFALTVHVNEKELATLVCSPADLKYMVVGFLCAEGILMQQDDLIDVTVDEEQGLAWVRTRQERLAEKVFLKRYINPCCGRARASFYFAADAMLCKPVTSSLAMPAATVHRLAEQLQERSHLFQRTGGVHGAALALGDEDPDLPGGHRSP